MMVAAHCEQGHNVDVELRGGKVKGVRGTTGQLIPCDLPGCPRCGSPLIMGELAEANGNPAMALGPAIRREWAK